MNKLNDKVLCIEKNDYGYHIGKIYEVKNNKFNSLCIENKNTDSGEWLFANHNFSNRIFEHTKEEKGENKIMTKTTKKLRKSDFGIENVIFNDPVTIVFFKDGTKFVSKKGNDDVYDPEVGIALAVTHHLSGSKQRFKEFVKKLNK